MTNDSFKFIPSLSNSEASNKFWFCWVSGGNRSHCLVTKLKMWSTSSKHRSKAFKYCYYVHFKS